jgi:hypothetical protein
MIGNKWEIIIGIDERWYEWTKDDDREWMKDDNKKYMKKKAMIKNRRMVMIGIDERWQIKDNNKKQTRNDFMHDR